MPKAASTPLVEREPAPRRSWTREDRPSVRRWLAAAVAAIGLGLCFAAASDALSVSGSVFDENGPIETIQAVLLAATTLVFCWGAWKSTDSKGVFCLGMTGASIVATLREVPRCGGAFYDGGLCVPQDDKDITLAVVAGLLLVALVVKRPDWRAVLDLRNIRYVWVVGLSAVALAIAEVAEHLHAPRVEESVELAAYGLLAAVALSVVRPSRT